MKITSYEVLGKLPDLFTFEDGRKVASIADWRERRQEIYKHAVELQYGQMPPEPEVLELVTDGILEDFGDHWVLSYEETELTGMAGTTTTFTVAGPRVVLTRSGSVNSQMVFEEGKQHTSLYETPFGELSIDIQTSRLLHNLTERGGLMEIK